MVGGQVTYWGANEPMQIANGVLLLEKKNAVLPQ